MPRLRFDFWQFASKGNTSETLGKAMTACAALADEDLRRLLPRATKVVRLHRLTEKDSLWIGDFVGIGTKRAAKKAHVNGRMEALVFETEEGLGEESAFLYDPETNAFVLQSNRLAATPSCVIDFFERFVGEAGPLDLHSIMNPIAIDQLSRFESITSFKVNMAAMDLGNAFKDKGHSASRLAEIASDLSGPSVKLEISVGHAWRKKGLSLDRVKEMARDLLSARSAIKHVEISGRTLDDDFEALDLVTQRLSETIDIEPDEGRGVAWETRLANLKEVFAKHRDFLKSSLARPGAS